jgi:hypothetical protein
MVNFENPLTLTGIWGKLEMCIFLVSATNIWISELTISAAILQHSHSARVEYAPELPVPLFQIKEGHSYRMFMLSSLIAC